MVGVSTRRGAFVCQDSLSMNVINSSENYFAMTHMLSDNDTTGIIAMGSNDTCVIITWMIITHMIVIDCPRHFGVESWRAASIGCLLTTSHLKQNY